MSIALLLHSLELGGAQLAVLRLAAGFAASGHRVAVVLQRESDHPAFDTPAGVELVRLDAPHVRQSVLPLVRFAAAWRPGVLVSALAHNNLAAIAASLLARRRFAVVVTEHAPLHHLIAQYGGWRYRVLPALLRKFYPRAAAIVGVSKGITAELATLLPNARMLRTIYNPISDDSMGIASDAPTPWPWTPDDRPLVLAAGRLAPEKDFPTLLRAFALLRAKLPVRLAIAGEGAERPRLAALARELGIADDVHLPGFVPNPYVWMRAARVLAVSSRFEGFGNVLVEALACGTPVVSTDCPFGPREIITDPAYGILVPVGDHAALAQALERAVLSPSDPRRLREHAARFSVAASVAGYEDVFRSIIPASACVVEDYAERVAPPGP